MPNIGISDQSILLYTQVGIGPCRVLEFDLNGKYIKEFGRGGKGPGEHGGYLVDELSYYPEKKQVFIAFSGSGDENQLFSSDGKFLSQIKNPVELTQGIKRFNDSVWMTPGEISCNPEFRHDSLRLIMYAANGKEIQVWPRTIYPTENRSGYSPGDDTLYKIGLDRLNPVAVFNLGPKGEVYNKYVNASQMPGTCSIKMALETERHWYLIKTTTTKFDLREYEPGRWGGTYEAREFLLVIDKKTGTARNVRFEDDFLGILSEPQNPETIRWTDDGQPFISFIVIQLKESIKIALKKENPEQKIRSKLEQLDKQITEDSNPVILLMKTKEDW